MLVHELILSTLLAGSATAANDGVLKYFTCGGSAAVELDRGRVGGTSKLRGTIPILRAKDPSTFLTFCDVTLSVAADCKMPENPPFEDGSRMRVQSDGAGGYELKLMTKGAERSVQLMPHRFKGEVDWLTGREGGGDFYAFLYKVRDSKNKLLKSYRLEYYAPSCHPESRPADSGVVVDDPTGAGWSIDTYEEHIGKVPDMGMQQAPIGSGNEPPPR